ncbi:glycosyltransferase family 32 protein [Sphingobacterium paucimobilis]|uniref:Glycosyl transferase n=1 Tax=Sphingobacterium paucimobilis HER1398 TaxID=1346330 RepID=U2J6V5_9SPHI|nr:glycosyltransferase [Sphingobacterium paucimobilis]ERJ60639.1 hypothetical protein M472_17930 [Sphingobacterium paucimobilis HER1398]
MAIPKTIYQTFKSDKLPWLTRFYIWRFLQRNKGWKREFFDDKRISEFFEANFDERTRFAYERLQIGAAKADFFRYAVLYIYGGVYLDMDSNITGSLDKYLLEDDVAILSREKNHPELFAQWALIYGKGHPFLKRTIAYMVDNIEAERFPHDVHATTGPKVYTRAIEDEMRINPDVVYREVGYDYKGVMQIKYKLAKLLLYRNKKNHWNRVQQRIPVARPLDSNAV